MLYVLYVVYNLQNSWAFIGGFQEFPNADDTYYLAHCYPYTYTDLKDDLDTYLSDLERAKVMKREVMCETRAGNSCFLLTVTNFGESVMSWPFDPDIAI